MGSPAENTLELSDEEFDKLNFDELVKEREQEVKQEVESKEGSSEEETPEDGKESAENEDTEDASEEETSEEVQQEEDEESSEVKKTTEAEEEDLSETDKKDEELDKKENESTEEDTSDKVEPTTINFEDEYNKLIAPFKANGKDIQVNNVDDAITLMQMGANYNKKMAGLKPNLKLIKMLQNNDLLDEDKLNYLIDISKKNPDAIQKLIKDSGIDPFDVEEEAKKEYKPNTYTVNDKEVELDSILDEIKDTESFNTTLDIVSNKLDNESRSIILEQPGIIKTINDHVQSGIYQQINTVIESERMLGRLAGVSDLQAYRTIGEKIQAAGGFTQAGPSDNQSNKTVKKTIDPKLRNRKKAASSTKASATKKVADYDPLSMSDEEFNKLAANNLI